MEPLHTRPTLLLRIRDSADDHAWREFFGLHTSLSRNIKASGHLNFRNTALDTLTADSFKLHPRAAEITPGFGPDVPYIGPGNARKRPNKTP